MEFSTTPQIPDKKPTSHSIKLFICFFKLRMGIILLLLVGVGAVEQLDICF